MYVFKIYRKKMVGGTFLHPPIMNRIHLLMNKEINLVSIFSDLFWDHRKDISWSVVRSQIPCHFFKKRWKCFLLLKYLDQFLYQALMSRVKDFLYTSVVSYRLEIIFFIFFFSNKHCFSIRILWFFFCFGRFHSKSIIAELFVISVINDSWFSNHFFYHCYLHHLTKSRLTNLI